MNKIALLVLFAFSGIELIESMPNKKKTLKTPYTCETCEKAGVEKKFESGGGLYAHNKKKHHIIITRAKQPEATLGDKGYYHCNRCDFNFNYKNLFDLHINNHDKTVNLKSVRKNTERRLTSASSAHGAKTT